VANFRHFLFRLSASHFLVLVPQKVTKEDDTQPSRPKGSLALLNKISGHETRPSSLHKTQAAAELKQSLPLLLLCLRYSA
jgi:hypothetical protein